MGPTGRVFSYETRTENVPRALRNIHAVEPNTENLEVRDADLYEGIEERDLDRVVLDGPEPVRALRHVAEALAPGGILLCYLPTILQVHRLVAGLDRNPVFDLVDSFEVLQRPWHVTQQSVRPAHRMVAHTAFLTTARRCQPRPVAALDEAVGEADDADDPDSADDD